MRRISALIAIAMLLALAGLAAADTIERTISSGEHGCAGCIDP